MKTNEVIAMIQAHMAGDHTRFSEMAEMIACHSSSGVAAKIRTELHRRKHPIPISKELPHVMPVNNMTRLPLMSLVWPGKEIKLDSEMELVCEKFIKIWEHIDDQTARALDIKPRVILYGLPGTGKTTAITEIARRIDLPVFIVDVSQVVSSYLGETLKNISAVFGYVKSTRGILFLDEIDAMGIVRGQKTDVGEMGRASVAFIQALDGLSWETPLAAATNRIDLVDPAVVRRFFIRHETSMPNQTDVQNWVRSTLGWNFIHMPDRQMTWADAHDFAGEKWLESIMGES